MSYDVHIYSRSALNTEFSDLQEGWEMLGQTWLLKGRGWQILFCPTIPADLEDIPSEVLRTVPGLKYRSELTLHPFNAPEAGRKQFFKFAKKFAKASHGVVLDLQTDEVITPTGIKRFVPKAREPRFSVIKLGWWFLGDKLSSKDGIDGLLKIFERLVPEAVPRRYGVYEPPQFHYSEQGREHLLNFLESNLGDWVIYTTRPILGLYLSYVNHEAPNRNGFRSHHLSVKCEASAIEQPGWQEGLFRFLREVSIYLDVFYGEARTLKGFVRMGSACGVDNQTADGPIRSWFWRGIPRTLGHSIVLGGPYTDLWQN